MSKPPPSTPMPPPSTPIMDESPPNATKATIVLVGHDAQIKKLASMQDKLSNVIASTQTGLNKTYMDADVSIASLWRAHIAMQKQLDEVCIDLTTLIETLKVTSPMKKAKKRRACIKKSPAKDHCSNSPRSRASHCDRIGGLFVDFAVRGGARLDGLRQLRQRVLYAVSGRCVCTFARATARALRRVRSLCVYICPRGATARALRRVRSLCVYICPRGATARALRRVRSLCVYICPRGATARALRRVRSLPVYICSSARVM
jgi:plasmid stabilization system protein ParE